MKRLLWIGLVIVGFVLVGQQGQAKEVELQWGKFCVLDKLRNKHNSATALSSKINISYGNLNGSQSIISLFDMYQEDAGFNCTKPNYNMIGISIDRIDVLPCEKNTNTCTITMRFDNDPIQSFTPYYMEPRPNGENSAYLINSPKLIHQFKTHRSVIIELNTVKGTTQYEFDLRGFDHPVLTNDYK